MVYLKMRYTICGDIQKFTVESVENKMPRKNLQRSVVLPPDTVEALNKYAAQNHSTTSEVIRGFIEKGLAVETYEKHQSEIRKYIREEIENTIPVVVKPYMERLIKMQANAMRTSAAALMSTVAVLSESYIDNATPEEILANALRLSTAITKSKPKSDAEYLAEAKAWINADLGKQNDN